MEDVPKIEKPWWKRHLLALLLLGEVLVMALLGLLLSWFYPPSDWITNKFEGLRNLFLVVAGLGGVFFLTWRTTIANTEAETKKIDAETRKQDSETKKRDSQTNKDNSINNMYTIAIEQLGKEHEKGRPNLEVRIGALYSLEKLAQANADYRQSIMDVLCSYVRNNAPLPRNRKSPEESEYASQNKDKPRTDIQTALTIIGRSNARPEESRQPIDLSNCYLVGADLQKADLQKANLQGTNLREVYLEEVHLQGASLEGVNLQGAYLREADLQGAVLYEADLEGVYLWWANLEGAHLQRACLRGAHLREANLREANLWGASLQGARLQDANLQDADLEGADLRECHHLGSEQLQSAKNWELAYRAPELACGENIPDPSEKDEDA